MHNAYIYRAFIQLESKLYPFNALLFKRHLVILFPEMYSFSETIHLSSSLKTPTLVLRNIPLALQYLSYPRILQRTLLLVCTIF